MRKSLTKYEHRVVEGSIKQIAEKEGKSLANALFDADAVDYVDTSGSMMSGIGGHWDRDGRTRHDIAEDELGKLQAEFPGKVAVYSWSSEEPRFCPDGRPFRFNGGTNMRLALEHMKRWDDTGVALYLTSDGYPDVPMDNYDLIMSGRGAKAAEENVLEVARTFKSPIHTIFIGGDQDSEARDFMRRLAEATGGRHVTAKEVARLYDPTKMFMLQDGIKAGKKEPDNSSNTIVL